MGSYSPVSIKVISICLQANPVNIVLVQIYAATTTADKETIASFYHEVQYSLGKTPKQ